MGRFRLAVFFIGKVYRTRPFDVVMLRHNSMPHALTDEDILCALKKMYSCLRPGGGCLITISDYDQEQRSTSNLVKPYGKAKIENDKRFISLQV